MDPEIARSKWTLERYGWDRGFSRGIEMKMKYLHVFGSDEEIGMLLVTKDDNVYGIGYSGQRGLLGVPNRYGVIYEDMLISKLSHQGVTRISVGGEVGAAITADGRIFHWGRDLKASYDEEDDDTATTDVCGVHQPEGSDNHSFINVACGDMFVAALTNRGQVILWGLIHERAQIVYGHIFPVSQITAFSCGMNHIAMLSASGDVFTCGFGSYGALGRHWSPRERYLVAKPVTLEHSCTRVVQVACGSSSTLFLMEDGSLWATGVSNDECHHLGVCVDEVEDDVVRFPERVSINEKVKRIAATMWEPSIYAAMTVKGNIFTWGEEEYPWKIKNESKLISAFYGKGIPSDLGDVIQPNQPSTSRPRAPGQPSTSRPNGARAPGQPSTSTPNGARAPGQPSTSTPNGARAPGQPSTSTPNSTTRQGHHPEHVANPEDLESREFAAIITDLTELRNEIGSLVKIMASIKKTSKSK